MKRTKSAEKYLHSITENQEEPNSVSNFQVGFAHSAAQIKEDRKNVLYQGILHSKDPLCVYVCRAWMKKQWSYTFACKMIAQWNEPPIAETETLYIQKRCYAIFRDRFSRIDRVHKITLSFLACVVIDISCQHLAFPLTSSTTEKEGRKGGKINSHPRCFDRRIFSPSFVPGK